MKQHRLDFRFSPQLIILLGEQLIHDKKIALAELVKNSYDADASFVEIRMNSREIVVKDDGLGMDLEVIKNVWLQPGVSRKKQQVSNRELTPKYKRMPIGEKGVGRLGAHKLGKRIEVYSKKEGANPIHFSIDWRKIEEANDFDSLDAILVEELERKPHDIYSETGTLIKISDLKEEYKKDFSSCASDLLQIISPFSPKENFDIKIYDKNNELFGTSLKERVADIKDKCLYQFKIVVNKGLIEEFTYQFRPWKSIEKVPSRTITLSQNRKLLQKIIKAQKLESTLDLDEQKQHGDDVGEIIFEGFIYDFDQILLRNEFSSQEKKDIKDYMKKSGGIRVYRDAMRIYNYGDQGFDILDLDLKRVNRPAGKISSNQIAGLVQLKQGESAGLIEKTNREGFIHNEAFEQLKKYLEALIQLISELRQDDKAKITAIYLNKVSKADIGQKIKALKLIVDRTEGLDEAKKTKIKKEFDNCAKEIDHLKTVLITASNTGLNLTYIVHELDKVITHLENQIAKRQDWNKVAKACAYLKVTLDAYKKTIRLDKKSSRHSLDKIVDQAISNFNFRFESHSIDVDKNIEEGLSVTCKEGLIIGVLNNLFDNAIYWLKTYGIKDKKIIIKAYQEKGFLYLVVADNGKGFNISFNSALQAFVSGRSEESTLGIGLHLAEQVMIAHQGHILEGDPEEERLPKEFQEGATIKLQFRQELD